MTCIMLFAVFFVNVFVCYLLCFADNLTVWDRVKALIKKQNKTQEILAYEIGVTKGTVHNWIARDIFPKANMATKIARALGVSVEYLVDGVQPSGQAGVELREKAPGYDVGLEDRVKARPVVHGIVRDLLAIPDDKLEAVGYMVAGLKAAEEKRDGSKMA